MSPAEGLSDLHRHLDGSLRPETLLELAERFGISLPERLTFRPGMELHEALSLFRYTLAVLERPSEVRRVAGEICEDAAKEGVDTLEIRFAPQLHPGGSIEEVVEAALEGIDGRAGLLLCGLYGEPPETLELLAEIVVRREGVVGLDLAGGPRPGHGWGIDDYAAAFRRVAEAGRGRTVHAGEGRPPAEIRRAVEVLGAQRIGHGTSLLDDPGVVDLVVEKGVVIEACLTSNVHTGAIAAVEEHPLPKWLSLGVRACVNTDNTLFSATEIRHEMALARGLPGMDDSRLAECVATGHAAAFAR